MVRGARAIHVAILGVLAAGVITGLWTTWLGWLAPSFSRAGSSLAASALACAAGWTLMLAGGATAWRPSGRIGGALLMATGVAWFIGDWANPASGLPLLFTLGLLLGAAWPAVLAHAVLRDAVASVPRSARRVVVVAAYVTNIVVLGLVPTLAFDPRGSRCLRCPDNLLALADDPALVIGVTRIGFVLEAAWVAGAMVLLAVRLAGASRHERRRTAPAYLPAAVALGAAAAGSLYSIGRGRLSNDPVDVALWSASAVALICVAAGVGAGWLRRRDTRQRVARLVLDLAATPPAGALAASLGRMLDDPGLEVLFPVDDGRFVDASGAQRSIAATATRSVTHVQRVGVPIAVLVHRADLALDAGRIADAVDAARLALENERLHALNGARLLELRQSRALVVAASAAERRRLERDLHDGSQQRLLALAIDLAVARRRAATVPGEPDDRATEVLETEVREALGDLRELAHGIAPRALVEDGLAAALEELAERSTIPIDLVALPSGRLDPAAEAVAYIVAARATRDAAVRRASIEAKDVDERLVVNLQLDVTGEIAGSMLVDLEDQCGAVDGSMSSGVSAEGRAWLRAEVPCGS